MKIAVISDIHSNKYALISSLKFLEDKDIDCFIFLGDYFGYYPWANETFIEIKKLFGKSFFILGNHDELITRVSAPSPTPEYWNVILQNRAELSGEALEWLKTLQCTNTTVVDNLHFKLFHGTPDAPLTGRYYPDNKNEYDWFPKKNEILLMGHTHYPIYRKIPEGGIIVNPGSLGQPRDGILESSMCVINTNTLEVEFHRVPYFIDQAIQELEKMNWYTRAINSLKKQIKNKY